MVLNALGSTDGLFLYHLSIRSVRAQEIDLEPVDARLEKLAEHALEDTDYQTMIKYLMDDTPLEEMDKHSELYLMGSERQYMSTVKCNNGCSLVVKNGEEVLIPKGAIDAKCACAPVPLKFGTFRKLNILLLKKLNKHIFVFKNGK